MFNFLKEKIKNAVSRIAKKIETEVKEEIHKEIVEKPIKAKKIKKEEVKKQEIKEEKKGLFAKFKEKITTKKVTEEQFNGLFWDLELALLENNVAVEVIEKIKEDLKNKILNNPIKRSAIEETIKGALKESIGSLFDVEKVGLIKRIKEKKEKPFIIIFVGVNGSGKCVTGDTLIPLANGELIPIKNLYAKYLDKEVSYKDENYIENPEIKILSLDKNLKIKIRRPIIICKLKAPKYLKKISLVNGMDMKVTKEHPLLSIKNGQLIWVKADNIKKGMWLAVPRLLPKVTDSDLNKELLEKLSEGFFVKVDSYENILDSLKKKYGNFKKAHKELNIKHSYCTFVGYWKYKKIMPLKLYLKIRSVINTKIKTIQFGGSKPIKIPTLNNDLAELVGLVLAEGHLNEKVCEITNKDIKIIHRFIELNRRLFNLRIKYFIDSRGLIRARLYNWSAIKLLNEAFEIPFGNKSRKISVPNLILRGWHEIIKAFLRSYLEAEAHIGIKNRTIEITTASKKMARGLVHLFLILGIESTLSKRVTNVGTFYRVFINGVSKQEKIFNLGLYTHKAKTLKENTNLPRQYEITNLIPECNNLIKSLRQKQEIFQRDLSEVIGCRRSMVSLYESGISVPRQNLLKIADLVKSKYLSKLAQADISWIKLESIKTIKNKEKWVYDLSMENGNFVANNIISHNTTTIAKVASLLQNKKLKCVIAAADTWRAASIQQLEEHGRNLHVKVIRHNYGSDPAAVAFDAIKHARSANIDVVLVDTAGRQHSNTNLMEEMKKIIKVTNPDLKIFIGEAIVGNDAVNQANEFNEAVGIDGVILTKQDVDEKGGASISISYITKKPIIFIGTGQSLKDLKEFNKEELIKTLGL
ncbi:MAG: LAGLIDADG family homing endonuclease [Nanoarchaeota archaeon]